MSSVFESHLAAGQPVACYASGGSACTISWDWQSHSKRKSSVKPLTAVRTMGESLHAGADSIFFFFSPHAVMLCAVDVTGNAKITSFHLGLSSVLPI